MTSLETEVSRGKKDDWVSTCNIHIIVNISKAALRPGCSLKENHGLDGNYDYLLSEPRYV